MGDGTGTIRVKTRGLVGMPIVIAGQWSPADLNEG